MYEICNVMRRSPPGILSSMRPLLLSLWTGENPQLFARFRSHRNEYNSSQIGNWDDILSKKTSYFIHRSICDAGKITMNPAWSVPAIIRPRKMGRYSTQKTVYFIHRSICGAGKITVNLAWPVDGLCMAARPSTDYPRHSSLRRTEWAGRSRWVMYAAEDFPI